MRNLEAIQQQTYDLIVIGGGINGAGVARDAALRGLKTILLEKDDFASGTSSWSTRLVHGGLRYLEYFEFSLVRESLREREILLRTAPHLVHPLMLTVPVYGQRSRPYWKINAGMILYDIFSFDKSLPGHRMLPKQKFRQVFRHLDTENLNGGAQYYDAQAAYAERLCWENILAAEQAGATVLNYAQVEQLQRSEGRITQITARDRLTDTEFTVGGSENAVVINTAGPWVDRVCQRGVENGKTVALSKEKKIGGTKGSHIIVDTFAGAPETALYVEAKSDGRPFFIVPWLGKILIGTTDIPYRGDLDTIKASNEEIDYLLRETNLVIPSAQLTRGNVLFTYAGVRPLPNQEGKKPGSVTRRHILYDHTQDNVRNLISLIGGKLTTYRQVGEELVDAAYKKMNRKAPACPTQQKPLPGAILPSDLRLQEALRQYSDRIPMTTLHHLFSIYGARALEVLAWCDETPELAEAIAPGYPDIKAQAVYAIQKEHARTLLDIMRRRTVLAMQGNYGFDAVDTVVDTLQQYGGWSANQSEQELDAYRRYMENNCIPEYALPTHQKELSATRTQARDR
ncbi:glycerol-3-phosphate dehydrogenase [Geitlerinema sp. PCC 9228]|jgi:glycerol-3-phosphate dehydrogenase|uniref:glycerol-3-phosphate dehydrogenase n=1 Tax=Geitlerinema sp. PCC 9228 TaxID=111611 RepID=UPI0008F9C62D|nr:glycerol-3-phosphate dehydrogenase [Geitlerinema sp. PCC 9228]